MPFILADGMYTQPPSSKDPSVGIRRNLSVGCNRPLKSALDINLLKLLISSRGWSKPTDSFRQIPTLGFVVGLFDLGNIIFYGSLFIT